MAHYRKGSAYVPDRDPRYIVVQTMLRQVVEFETLAPMAELRSAMAAAIARLAANGWQAETPAADYGSTFIRRGDDRRLLMLTKRHPHDDSSQSFNPFK